MPIWLGMLGWVLLAWLVVAALCKAASDDPPAPPMKPRLVPPAEPQDTRSAAVVALDRYRREYSR